MDTGKHQRPSGNHLVGGSAAIAAGVSIAGASIWRLVRQEEKVKTLHKKLQLYDKYDMERTAEHQGLQELLEQRDLEKGALTSLLAERDSRLQSISKAEQAAAATLKQASTAQEGEQAVHEAAVLRLQVEAQATVAEAKRVAAQELAATRNELEQARRDVQAEQARRHTAEADADAAKTTAVQRLQEQVALTMAEEERASLAESQLSDIRNELQAALQEVQMWKRRHGEVVEGNEEVVAAKGDLDRKLRRSNSSLQDAEETIKAYRGELADKEQRVKEAEQAGEVASLKRQLAKKNKTNEKMDAVRGDLQSELAAVKKKAKKDGEVAEKKVAKLVLEKRQLQSEVHVLTPASTAQAAATVTPAKKSKKAKKKSKGVEEGTLAAKKDQAGDNNSVTISEGQESEGCAEVQSGSDGNEVMENTNTNIHYEFNPGPFSVTRFEQRRLDSGSGWRI